MPWASHMPRNVSGKQNCSTGTGEDGDVKTCAQIACPSELVIVAPRLPRLETGRASKHHALVRTRQMVDVCVCNPQTVCTGFTGASRRFRVSISYFREIFMHVWTSHVPTHPPTYPSPYPCHLTLRAAAGLHNRSVTPSILWDRDAALGCHPD